MLWLRLWSMLGGRRFRIPTSSELFTAVAYMHHNAAIRATLAQLDPSVDHAKGGEAAAEGAADAECEADAAFTTRAQSAGPLMYVRPLVGSFPTGDYADWARIAAFGLEASVAALARWEGAYHRQLSSLPAQPRA